MNLVHLKYAVEVAKTKSISKAAENLYMGQPNLSRAIKELEDSLGITIFSRTTKGISVTPDGEEFLQYAKRILAQVDEVEEVYRNGKDLLVSNTLKNKQADSNGFVSWTFPTDNCESGYRKIIVRENGSDKYIQTSILVK